MYANRRPTILIFADVVLTPNGVTTFCRSLQEWSEKSQAARVVVLRPAREDRVEGADGEVIGVRPMIQVPNPLYPDLLLGRYSQAKLRRIVESFDGPKVIHIATPGLLGVSAAKLAKRLNIPSVGGYNVDTRRQCVEAYLHLKGSLAAKVAAFLDRRAYGNCQAMWAPSESAAEAAGSFYDGEVSVIPYPIDMHRFYPAPTREGAFRQKYAPDGKVLAAVVGRVAKEKNLDLACKHLLHDDRIRTVFVGDGPYRRHLERKWNATVTGFLHGSDLLAAYQQSDLFVQFSVKETFGLTLAEATAAGLPAVVLRSRAFVDHTHEDSGVEVVEEEELGTMADRCVALVSDKERHRDYAIKNRALAERFSAETLLPKFVALHAALAR
jgi:phosphatidylinositol alpha 1,6-mannosyltransferase